MTIELTFNMGDKILGCVGTRIFNYGAFARRTLKKSMEEEIFQNCIFTKFESRDHLIGLPIPQIVLTALKSNFGQLRFFRETGFLFF